MGGVGGSPSLQTNIRWDERQQKLQDQWQDTVVVWGKTLEASPAVFDGSGRGSLSLQTNLRWDDRKEEHPCPFK